MRRCAAPDDDRGDARLRARVARASAYPVSDLVYRNAFPLLMQDVTLALVIDKEVIGGVKCDHLLFSRPGVDFQVWVAEGGTPLPHKYVVTDTGTPELLSITSIMSDWNVAPAAADAQFNFVPPQGTKAITFMPIKQAADLTADTTEETYEKDTQELQ